MKPITRLINIIGIVFLSAVSIVIYLEAPDGQGGMFVWGIVTGIALGGASLLLIIDSLAKRTRG